MGATHEQLAGFLGGFTDAVKSGAVESKYVHFKSFSPSHAYTFKDETGAHDAYAQLTIEQTKTKSFICYKGTESTGAITIRS